eukprot:4727343-Lingulodinium_polyedra.AAC.1
MGSYPMFHMRVLGGPPMPTLRISVRSVPHCPARAVCTVRSATSASATAVAQVGRRHRRKISASHSCPMRSKAFSWSASVIAGVRRRK